jgi:hypothetical protein
MLRNMSVLRVFSAMAIGLAVAGFPGLGYAASPFPLSLPPAGLGSVVLVNQDGGNEVLSVNFAGTTYTVAPQGSSSPNQVEFNIPPGTYSYAASVAGIGSVSGSVTIPQGHVISMAFIDNTADLANGDQNADDQPVVTQQVVSTNNDDESAESDNDNDHDHENGEGESKSLQAEESELHQEVSESQETAANEAAEHDTVAKNDDGIQVDPAKIAKPLTTNTGKTTTTNTLNTGKLQNLTTNAGKTTTTNTLDLGKGKNLTTNTGKVTNNMFNPGKGKNVTTNAGKTITVPFNPGKVTNFSTNVGKPNSNTFNPGKITNFNTNVGKPNFTTNTTNHSNTNSSTTTACAPGSPIFPACSNGNNGHNQTKGGKSGKKGDFLTINYTPADSGATLTVANDGGKHDSDDDNESSEQTVTTVVTPAFDNDELIVTITDITAQAQ